MDSEQRHELKENELAEFFTNFGEWWNRYGNAVLLVLVIAAGGFAGYRLYNSWTIGAEQTARADLAEVQTVRGYLDVAEMHSHPTVRTLAYLWGADLALEQARQPEDPAADDGETDVASMSPEEALRRAEAMYGEVLARNRQPVYRANALVGLANVAETQGDWDGAADYWRQAEQAAEGAHLPGLASQAQRRLAMLDDVRQPIVFATGPAPADVEAPDLTPGLDFLQDDAGDAGEAPILDLNGDEPADPAPAEEPSADDQPASDRPAEAE